MRFRTTLTGNGRNYHVTMFILNLPLAAFSFLEKLSSFALASKARISLHFSLLRTLSRKRNRESHVSRLS